MKIGIFIAGGLLALGTQAAEFFKVDFNDMELEKAPAVERFNKNATATRPTTAKVIEQGKIAVVKSAGGLTDQPLLLDFGLSNTAGSELIFDGGNNLVTSGTLRISFDFCPVEYRGSSDGKPETACSIRLTGNAGVDFAFLNFGFHAPDGRTMELVPAGGQKISVGSFELGKAYKFEFTVDFAASELALKIDGELKAEKVKVNLANAFRLFRFRSGQAIGGRDGALVIAVDNVVISN